MEEKIEETKKTNYLKDFRRFNNPKTYGFTGERASNIGTKIVDLMKKEGITYDQAYASLQFAYNLIKYESNFLTLK